MIRFDRCFCPKCGKEHHCTGRLGTSQQCSCGAWIPKTALDRVRYYWILQIAMSFGVASFFLAFTLFYRDLPVDSWDRFFSPILQVPATSSFLVSYWIVFRYKQTHDGDDLMMRYFIWGVSLMTVAAVSALLAATLNNL